MAKMRSLVLGGIAGVLALGVAATPSHASSVSFGDTVRYWPGYANGTSDDGKDTIGTPDLQGGHATYNDAKGLLTGVTINYTGRFSLVASGNGRVIPGDLFLDVGSDGHWDYVMKLVAGPQTPVASYASLSILDIRGIASPSYLMSGSDNTGYWKGFGIRDRHPYAWNGGGKVAGTGSFDPFNPLASGGTLSFHLGNGVPMNKSLTIGFAPSCGNDVLLAKVSAPVPEPTAALIFGVGLVAATQGRRRRLAR